MRILNQLLERFGVGVQKDVNALKPKSVKGVARSEISSQIILPPLYQQYMDFKIGIHISGDCLMGSCKLCAQIVTTRKRNKKQKRGKKRGS